MKKIIALFFLLILFGCEYKTINIQEYITMEDAVVITSRQQTDTVFEYNIALKMILPRKNYYYKTIIRSTVTGVEYEFDDLNIYEKFNGYQNCKAKIVFKYTLKTQQNTNFEKRVLESVRVQKVYLLED